MLEKTSSASVETPWGQSWDSLFTSLRPSPSDLNTLSSLVDTIDDTLRAGNISHVSLHAGSGFGKGTLIAGDMSLDVYAQFGATFSATSYFESHLQPMLDALTSAKGIRFADINDRGLAIHFSFEGVSVRLFAAGALNSGPKELLAMQGGIGRQSSNTEKRSSGVGSNARGQFPAMDERGIHVETSCALLRVGFIAMQSPLYKDMVRVAKKWRATSDFMVSENRPGDYLLELLMLEAYLGAPVSPPTPDSYATIFRRFLSLVSSQSGTGSEVVADDAMPRSFLSWPVLYNHGAVEQSIALGLLKTGSADHCSLVVVDPAVPFANVATTVADWGEIRAVARNSLSHFQNSELLEQLQTKLNSLSEGMEEVIIGMQQKIAHLQSLEESPRRWSGNIQFKEVHMNGENWTKVTEVELRTVTWRVNARKSRTDGVGYSKMVDISLQRIGKPLTRTIDVDVNFRSKTSNLVFDANNDHVLIVGKSEVLRNRNYPIQITIVA
ncbi:unnamed protein product [Chondrus crispus]|uniref:Uncharacterized protein n=1 Tax=Chondrus crispus TaxID=2769 RepID=R7QIV2_CHOCR|nr:unnamed protein product [Chondrus crispus]CDF37355.1 unnamed protein product [Chondrus crispus]|eukprot:XP_005717174.1 unnamed protein product [Chondrus crispus]